MTDHSIVLIDAGYLLAESAKMVTGSSLRRGVNVKYDHLLKGLLGAAETDSGLPALRAVWYDAARGGQPTEEQRRVGRLPRAKLRIGRISVTGEQKGVDLRLGLDLITLSASPKVEVIYLVSGDDDLAEAVEQAQEQGVQVVLLGIPGPTATGIMSASDNLVITADRVLPVPAELLRECVVAVTSRPTPAAVPAPAPASPTSAPPALNGDDTTFPTPRPGKLPQLPEPLRVEPVPIDYGRTPQTVGVETAEAQPAVLDPFWVRERIDTVVDRIVATLRITAAPDELTTIRSRRPSIPADLDRVLLRDTVTELNIEDLPDRMRFDLREAFWDAIDEIASSVTHS